MSIAFERAKKTFLGFLQARGKAINTIKNYACDLAELGQFCQTRGFDFQKLGLTELEAYHEDLKIRGLRPNSRRRKLMTAKSFLRYLSGRMDVSTVGSEKIIPPDKVEAPPRLVPRESLMGLMEAQPTSSIGFRNRALIGVLLDTGMLVTEALALRPQDCFWDKTGAMLSIGGKRARKVRVSKSTAEALKQVAALLKGPKYFFYGYSKAGPNAERLTARGVELLFKGWATSLGAKHLHPRTLRHLFVIENLLQGKNETEIMQSLGLKTPYAFRVYRPLAADLSQKNPLVKSSSEATYKEDADPAKELVRP
ncbi:MAG: tyrosine-type recombinase/integrase [Bdellovibrionota bacterium]